MSDSLKYLKSGTDIRGVAVKTEQHPDIDFTEENINKIMFGFVKWLECKINKKADEITVAIGHDSRISSEEISDASVKALNITGANVIDCGMASTPAMFMAVRELNCDASIQITASHHPFDRNGFKFFTYESGVEGSDIDVILDYADKYEKIEAKRHGSYKKVDFMSRYAEMLRDILCREIDADNYSKPLDGYKIAVDAGNGVGGFFAESVLKPLGANISGSQFLDPDGMFPNHIPNPENETAMKFICDATVKSKSDLGLIFDTDVDRSSCVDNLGNEINRNRLIAIASEIAISENPGATIVTDSVTSTGLHKFIEESLGGKHHRFKRGYRNVINEAKRLIDEENQNAVLAIETSGHAAFKENYFLDDGAYLAVKIIAKMVQLGKQGLTLNDLIKSMDEPVEGREIRYNILKDDFKSYGEAIVEDLKGYILNNDLCLLEKENYEGVRINFDKSIGDGWLLLRLSVHDPVIVVNMESDSKNGTDKMYDFLSAFLQSYDSLEEVKS